MTTVASVARATGGDELVPLIDLGPDTYQGAQGGLYPGGVNAPPATHAEAALVMAEQTAPRDATGAPDADGLIGFITLGMSNTNQEFGAFVHQEDANVRRNARVVILGTAQGGLDSTLMADPEAFYWQVVDEKIAAAGLTPAQVQVAWLKQGKSGPKGGFREAAEEFRDEIEVIVQILHDRFPNLRLAYLSSRIYAGYATGAAHPEPYAYETGFSIKWLIENQIEGDPDLNYGQLPGAVRAPLLLWGPYLWANGATPNGNGTFYVEADFEDGGRNAHPAAPGEQKVADLLSGFFAGAPSARPWWPKQPDARLVSVPLTDDAFVDFDAPDANFGADPSLITRGAGEPAMSYLRFVRATGDESIAHAKLGLRIDETRHAGLGLVAPVLDPDWDEDTITFANAPALGTATGAIPRGGSRGGYTSTAVTDVVRAAGTDVELACIADPNRNPDVRTYDSKEGRHTPRLVLVVIDPCPPDIDDSGTVDFDDLLALLAAWGPCPGCEEDLDGDAEVGFTDLLAVLAAWGACP